jgi:hypothetical protein
VIPDTKKERRLSSSRRRDKLKSSKLSRTFNICVIIVVIIDERSMTVSNSGRPPSYHEKPDR